MTQWEYKYITIKTEMVESELTEWLNTFGIEGWELVLANGGEFVFKRKLH